MKPAAAWAYLLSILAGLALAAWLSPRAYRHGHVPLEKPPEALAERSKEIIRRFGYTEKAVGSAWGFDGNGEYRQLGRGARQVEDPLEGHGRRPSGRDLLLVPAESRPAHPRALPRGRLHRDRSDRERSAAHDERHGQRRARHPGPPDPFRGGPVFRAAGVVDHSRLVDSSRRSRARRRGLLTGATAVASPLVRGRAGGVGRNQARTTGPAALRRGRGRARTAGLLRARRTVEPPAPDGSSGRADAGRPGLPASVSRAYWSSAGR